MVSHVWMHQLMRRMGSPASSRRLTRQAFAKALERERLRTDRGGPPFSVLHFVAAGENHDLISQLASKLDQRLRQTDEFGDYGEGLGVILPGTLLEAACQLGKQVVDEASQRESLRWHCYEYPSGRCAGEVPGDSAAAQTTNDHQSNQPSTFPVASLFIKPLPIWKRLLDIILATVLLVITFPVLVIAALAIKLTSPGPVIFRQRRMGIGGKPFTMYKLRTMCVDAETRKAELRGLSEQDGPAFKMKNDPRVTKVGKYLRLTCIDELPQLWNVLRGDMTLVGPRPLPCDEAEGCLQWQKRRLDVTPGLTCIWQARSGKERVPFADWMRMDLRYIKERNLWNDFKLLWKTFVAVLRHRASH